MTGTVKFVLGMIVGGAIGVASTYIYDKKRYDRRFQTELQKEIEVLKGLHSENGEEIEIEEVENKSEREETDEEDDDLSPFRSSVEENSIKTKKFKRSPRDYRNYKDIVDDEDYGDIEDEPVIRKTTADLAVKPYIFDPEDGYIPEDYKDYEHLMVYFDPMDYDSCCTELGEELTDVNAKIGYENLDVLKEKLDNCPDIMNPPSIFVRNERMGIEYEITFDGVLYH